MEYVARLAANMVKRDLGIKLETKTVAGESVITETTYDFTTQKATGWYLQRLASAHLVEGVTYLFKLDGKQYISKCKRINETDVYIGNAAYGMSGPTDAYVLNGEDTGEPFCVAVRDGADSTIVMVSASGSHTYSLWTTTQTKTITPIDPKFLPIYTGEVE